ncbi:MAG: peptide ABC transporter substrate-binding protein [Patescibacteria group bacterium]|jgi:peptide/nickel transport system substrate-binding protein
MALKGRTIFKAPKRWIHSIRAFFVHGKHTKSNDSRAMNQVLRARNTPAVPSVAQLRVFPTLLSSKEKKIAGAALLVLVFGGLFLGWKLYHSSQIVIPAVGGTYTEGIVGIPQLINPLYAMSSDVDSDLSRLVYSGLMRTDSEGNLVADLAESYTISEDEKTYTFILRSDARWHDAKPVIADDVVFTISAIQNPDYRSPLSVSFAGIGVTQTDERTIIFTLSEPFAPFLSLLTTGILPSHLWQNIAPANAATAALNKKPIGSGPYKFEKLVKDTDGNVRSYTFVRDERFYRTTPYLESITFKFYGSTAEAADALRNHNVEGLAYLSSNDVQDFESDHDLTIYHPDIAQYTAIFFNQSHSSILANDAVRTALSMATDKNAIIASALSGFGTPINSCILPGMIGEKTDLATIAFDLEGAKAKLEEEDWTLAEGASIRTNGDATLTLELVTLNATELVETAKLIKDQWATAGVDLQIKIVTNVELQSDILKNRDYDMLLSGELYGVDPDPYAFWHSSQANFPGLNLSMFSYRKADEYIEAGRTTNDLVKRAEAYQNLQVLIAEEVPAIFLYQPKYSYVLPSRINEGSISLMTSPSDRLADIADWYIKTKRTFAPKAEEVTDSTEETTETTSTTEEPAVDTTPGE